MTTVVNWLDDNGFYFEITKPYHYVTQIRVNNYCLIRQQMGDDWCIWRILDGVRYVAEFDTEAELLEFAKPLLQPVAHED